MILRNTQKSNQTSLSLRFFHYLTTTYIVTTKSYILIFSTTIDSSWTKQ